MARKPRTGQCVYCGIIGTVTKDHVPPKCLFPLDTRVNLMTVAACPTCHGSFKLDDEYFKLVIGIRDDLPSSVSANFLRDQTRRTIKSPGADGLRSAILAATKTYTVRTADGRIASSRLGMRVDATRVIRTCERIVRALYSKFFGAVLPATHEVGAVLLDLQKDNSAFMSEDIQECLSIMKEGGTHKKYNDVLEVFAAKTIDDEYSSMWLIRIYEAFVFIGYTTPIGNSEEGPIEQSGLST